MDAREVQSPKGISRRTVLRRAFGIGAGAVVVAAGIDLHATAHATANVTAIAHQQATTPEGISPQVRALQDDLNNRQLRDLGGVLGGAVAMHAIAPEIAIIASDVAISIKHTLFDASRPTNADVSSTSSQKNPAVG